MIIEASRMQARPFERRSSFEQRLNYQITQAGIKNPGLLITDQDRQEQFERALAMYGNTPVTLHQTRPGMILVKRLSQQPSGAHYDEGYLRIHQELEEAGAIWPTNRNKDHYGQRVELIELTSGSAGIGFGVNCKIMGFEGTILVPLELEGARVQPMKALGLNVVVTPAGYVRAASEHLGEYIEHLKANGYSNVRFRRPKGNRSLVLEKGDHRVAIVNHSENQATVNSFRRVGQEMAEFLPAGVSPDYFLTILGNFTSTIGIGSELRAKYPRMKIVGLEDMTNPNWFDLRYPGRFQRMFRHEPTFEVPKVQGSSQRGVPLYFANPDFLDDIRVFDPDQTISYQRDYNYSVGRSVIDSIGRSSAASLMVAEEIAREHPGSITWVLNYDKGDRNETFVPAFTESLSLVDALAYNRFEYSKIQPFGWQQVRPITPLDIPTSLQAAYSRN